MTTAELEHGQSGNQFVRLQSALGSLDADVAASILTASADIALVIGPDGVIQEAAFSPDEPAFDGRGSWIGRAWSDLVTEESRPKVSQLLHGTGKTGSARWREINHLVPEGQVAIRFSAVPLQKDGLVLAVGRSLAAVAGLQQRLIAIQRSMERDYARLRNVETRYRHLFQLTSEGVIVVDGATLKLTEANPTASSLLNISATRLVGRPFADLFHVSDRPAAEDFVILVRTTGRADLTPFQPAHAPGILNLTASLFRQEGVNHILVRFSPADAAALRPANSAWIADMFARLPDAFVVVDDDRRVLESNASFLELAELATDEQARGQPLDRWLGRTSVDFNVMMANLREHHSLRDFRTVLRGEFGRSEPVEVTAVSVPSGESALFGFVMRAIGRVPGVNPLEGPELFRSASELAELVGRMALKDIVRETADLIEKMCIEAALKSTGDNRASAAQMLGLSRQSLYSKLRRYGIDDVVDAD